MRDNLGRFWKVEQSDGKRGTRFICYEKHGGGRKLLSEMDVDPAGSHVSRKRTGGLACNGGLYGSTGFQICGKCAALVDDRRR